MRGVDATFISPWRFSLEGDRTAEFRLGQRLFAFCGEDGAKAVYISAVTYTGSITVIVTSRDSDRITNQLATVAYQREEELVNELVWEGASEPPDYFRGILWLDTTIATTTTTSSSTTTTTTTIEPIEASQEWSYGESIESTEEPVWSYGESQFHDIDPLKEPTLTTTTTTTTT
jgi:hypothetical protein